MMHKDL